MTLTVAPDLMSASLRSVTVLIASAPATPTFDPPAPEVADAE